MFIVTIINFLIFSWSTGIELGRLVVFIRKALILDIDYPLPEKRVSVNNVLHKLDIVLAWAVNLPVSIKLSLSDPVSIHDRWRCLSAISLSFGGLGSSSQINSG